MAITLSAKRIRPLVDTASYAAFRDALTGNTPQCWRGVDLRLEVGLFYSLDNNTPTDDGRVDLSLSGFQSMTCEVKASATTYALAGTLTSGSASVTGLASTSALAVGMAVSGTGIAAGTTIAAIPGSTSLTLSANATASGTNTLTFGSPNLMAQTVSSFDNTLTAATWLDYTKQHAVFAFSSSETNIAAGTYHLVFSAITSAGRKITLGASTLQIIDDGAGFDAGNPATNPGAAISLAEADERYSLIDEDGDATDGDGDKLATRTEAEAAQATAESALGEASNAAAAAGTAQATIDAHLVDMGNPHSVTAAQVGLGNCDNTSDANKPVSTAQQTALNLKAALASPAFTGTPTVTSPATVSPSDGALLTRSQWLWEELMAIHRIRRMKYPATGNSGAGSYATLTHGMVRLTAGTANGGYALAQLFAEITQPSFATGGGIDFYKKITLAICGMFDVFAGVANTAFHRITVGGLYGSPPALRDANALSAMGFGVEFYDDGGTEKMRLFAHNGTSYVTSSGVAPGGYIHALIVQSDGAGNISLYDAATSGVPSRPSSTPVLTLAGGPTGSGTLSTSMVEVSTVNPSGAAPGFNSVVDIFEATLCIEN
jgi:hypothetical protein